MPNIQFAPVDVGPQTDWTRPTAKAGKVVTVEELQRQQALADALAGQAAQTEQIKSIPQGLNYLAQIGLSGVLNKRAAAGEEQRRQAMVDALMGGIDTSQTGLSQEQLAAIGALSPDVLGNILSTQLQQRMTPAPTPEPYTDYGRVTADERAGYLTPETAQAARDALVPAPDLPTSAQEYEYYRAGAEQRGEVPLPYEEWDASRRRAGATSVVSSPGETQYDRDRGAQDAARFGAFREAGTAAYNTLATLDRLDQIIDDPNFYSGNLANAALAVKQTLALFGINPDAAAPMEEFRSITYRSALEGMGGSLGTGFSNADRDFIVEQYPSLDATPTGNRARIEILRRIEQRKLDIMERAIQYELENGRLDSRFDVELAQWAAENPLFADLGGPGQQGSQPSSAGAGAAVQSPPQVGQIVDGWRFRGGDPADPASWEQVQ